MAASRTLRPDSPLAARVAAVLDTAGVGPGSRLCVALSGGVDSVVLLHLLAGLRPAAGFTLSAAHVHPGLSLRAGQWLAHCEALCRALHVPFTPLHVEVARDHPDGLEAAARHARHAALASIDCDWRVFGHHRDDQAETVLFRLLRGAGTRGAAAMAAVEPGRLRPLLDTARAEIVAYARANGLRWVEDESNADPRHRRNFLRHDILPRLERVFPAAGATLARAAANFREADALLADLAALDGEACGGERLRRDALCALPEPRARNLIRARLHALGLDAPPRARLVEVVRQLREGAEPLYVSLGEAACCVHRGEAWVERALGEPPVPVRWTGQDRLPWGAGELRLREATGEGVSLRWLREADEVVFAPRRVGLRLRTAPGRPRHGFKNLCQQAGVPPWLRDHLPVLYADGAPLWIAGIGVAAEAACASGEPGLEAEWLRR